MSEGLPKGWVEVTLNDISDWSSGGTPKATEPKYYNGSIPWLIIADLNNSTVKESAKKITQQGLENSSAKWVEIGSILIAMYGSIGKLGIAGIRCTTNQAIAFTTNIWGNIPNMYLFFYLKYNEPELLNMGQGGAQKNISQTILKKYPFLLPPLNEQKRIVAKLDAIMPRIDAVKERLDKVPGILKRFRQSVLTAAVTGRLTEQWREEHLEVESTDSFSELPIGWKLKNISDIALNKKGSIQSGPFGSQLLHSEFQESGILAIGIDNVQDGYFTLGRQHRISEKKYKELGKFTAKPLDVLITVMATVGRCCVIPSNIEKSIITKHVYRISCDQKIAFPFYILLTLRGCKVVIDAIQDQIRGATRPGINGAVIKKLIIPLPPLEEQKEIVQQVDKLFALADKVEAHYQKAKARVDKLSQSVLAKAFRGELVPQDPDDEPAEKLLERIVEEKAKMGAKLKGARKSGVKKTVKKSEGGT